MFDGMRVQRWDMVFHLRPAKAEVVDGKRKGDRRAGSRDEDFWERMPIDLPSWSVNCRIIFRSSGGRSMKGKWSREGAGRVPRVVSCLSTNPG